MFFAFDATLGTYADPFPPLVTGVPCARRCTWISSTWMTRDGATLDPDYAPTVAKVLAEGGTLSVTKPDNWRGTLTIKPEHASVLDILDFEAWLGNPAHYTTICKWIDNFKAAQPALKVGFYPTQFVRPDDVPASAANSREDAITSGMYRSGDFPVWLQKASIARIKAFNHDLFARLDFLCPSFYLLGPTVLDRDLAFFDAVRAQFASYGLPLYPFVWGAWHPSFNGPTTPPMTDAQLTRYVRWLRDRADGCVVWGEAAHNDALWTVIAREIDGVVRTSPSATTVRPPAR